MMENSVYSVITPEGCAAILWKSASQADRAAAALRLTATDLKRFGLIDEIVEENEPWEVVVDEADDKKRTEAFDRIAGTLRKRLTSLTSELRRMDPQELLNQRYKKFRAMGQYSESAARSEHGAV
jgi:acetyl-CoA carboxylase carboxyl transferase subunit alpha